MKYSGLLILTLWLLASACGDFRKGDMYSSGVTGDSIQYVVAFKGSGKKISKIASEKGTQYKMRGDELLVRYLTDSVTLMDQKSLLLFNSSVPQIKEDFLNKGFFGTFGSKQYVIMLLVSVEDFDKYFKKSKIKK